MDMLARWNDGQAKSSIIAFVRSVSEPGPGFVPPADRIAAFDNDGTLWAEKPLYVQADFMFRKWKAMVAADPGLAAEQPYKALVEGDRVWLAGMQDHVPELLKGLGAAFGGITTDAFEAEVRAFFADARHPTLGTPYTQVGYQPMIELLRYLEANDFKVFICTGGGRDFVRVVGEEMYGIPRERVIGSGPTTEYRDGAIHRLTSVEQPIDDGAGKPVHIWNRTGRLPLLAGGNSDGDYEMLASARFGLLVHHDDAAREFAYDAGSERALADAPGHGWTVASMKDDFATIFEHGPVVARS
jgi:phosphoglycolate phosphatase-like HAD superfamily hydrolase